MRYFGRTILWIILGAIFGTAVGIVARKLGYTDLSGGILAGMFIAPAMVVVLLLADHLDDLVFWTAGGALVGTLCIVVIGLFAQHLDPAKLTANFTIRSVISGAPVGAVVATWLGAGGAVFKRGTSGVIGLLLSAIAGTFFGAVVWVIGDLIGGELISVVILGRANSWRLGETLAGVPIVVLAGVIATKYLFVQYTASGPDWTTTKR